jgi:hypothetical protein
MVPAAVAVVLVVVALAAGGSVRWGALAGAAALLVVAVFVRSARGGQGG